MNQKKLQDRLLLGACAALCVYFLLIGPIIQLVKLTWTQWDILVDFEVFYKAGMKAFQHHTVYDVTDHWQYKYSPLIAYLFGATISQLNFSQAQMVFTVGLALLCPLLLLWVLNSFERDVFKDLKLSLLKKMGLVLLFYGNSYLLELRFGQVNLIPFALLFGFFTLYSKTSPSDKPAVHWIKLIAMATLWSLAIQIKLYSAIIGGFLLFRKEFKLIALTLIVTFGLEFLLLSQFHDWQFTVSENWAWIKTLTASSKTLLPTGNNGSLLGLMSREPYIQEVAGPVWIALLLGYLWIQYQVRNVHPLVNFALNLLAILLLNPLVWNYWTIFSAPAFLIVMHSLPEQPFKKQNLWVKLTLLLLFLNHILLFTKVSRRYGHPVAHFLLFVVFMQILLKETDGFRRLRDYLLPGRFRDLPSGT